MNPPVGLLVILVLEFLDLLPPVAAIASFDYMLKWLADRVELKYFFIFFLNMSKDPERDRLYG
jgi:hypothetical protein